MVHTRCGLSLARGIEPAQIDTSGAVLYHTAFVPRKDIRSMAEFCVKFRIKWDGRYVAGVSKISELRRSTEVTQHREGGDPSSRKSSGQIAFSSDTLKCG